MIVDDIVVRKDDIVLGDEVLRRFDSKLKNGYISQKGNAYSKKTNCFIKLKIRQSKYFSYVTFHQNGERYRYKVKDIVGRAFVENPENFDYILQFDKDKENNYYKNLYWSQYSERVLKEKNVLQIYKINQAYFKVLIECKKKKFDIRNLKFNEVKYLIEQFDYKWLTDYWLYFLQHKMRYDLTYIKQRIDEHLKLKLYDEE